MRRAPSSQSSGDGAVLVVDDTRAVLRTVKRVLEREFEVIAYASAEEALQRVRQGGVAVVLSDMDMPGMSGLELLREVRRWDQDLPVLLMTGAHTVEVAQEAGESGVFRVVQKPFDNESLRDAVDQARELYSAACRRREATDGGARKPQR